MNKKIALIGGTGPEGKGLAKRFAISGNEIYIGSRNKERGEEIALELKNELKENYSNITIEGGANDEMAKQATICIIVVPYSAHQETLEQIKEFLENKIKFTQLIEFIYKYSNHRDFTKFKKNPVKNVNEIYKIRNYVSLKLDTLGI